jgi:hypothetical protein
METNPSSVTSHLAKLKLSKNGGELPVWLVYCEYFEVNDQRETKHMCQEWASLVRNAAIACAAKEKKKCCDCNYHVYRAVLYLQDEEIALKDLVHEQAFLADDVAASDGQGGSLIMTDEEKPWVSNILWHLDLMPERFADIQDLPDSFIAALARHIPENGFMLLLSQTGQALRDRICDALPEESAEHLRKYLPENKDIDPTELNSAEVAFREACLALSVSYETNEYSPSTYDMFHRSLTAHTPVDTVNVWCGASSIYTIGYPVVRSLEAMPRLSIFGKLIYLSYAMRRRGHWGLAPFLRDETNPFFMAGLEHLAENKSSGFARRIGKMKKELLADLDRKMKTAGNMILQMKCLSSALSYADTLALLWSFDDDAIAPFPEESETNINIIRNSMEEYTLREVVCKLIYMGDKVGLQGLISIEMEAETEPCRILFRLLVTHLTISDEKQEAYYQELLRKGHLAETAKKIEMIREGFIMIKHSYSPHMMALALQVYLDGGQR